jgi:hypothetical protein
MPIRNCYKALRPELFHVTFGNNRGLGRANPCRDMKHLPYATDGYHTWSPDEVKQFEAHHKVGTKAHLAVALMLYLGVYRGDAVRLGKQHVRNGAVHFVPNKTRFGLWFRARCDVTGLPQCSAHGPRKARASILAERGAADRQLMAIPEDQNENSDCPTELSPPGKALSYNTLQRVQQHDSYCDP